MWQLTEPSPERVRELLAAQARAPFSYPAVGATRREPVAAPGGFDVDHNRTRLGEGEGTFAAACAAIERWTMFPAGWTRIVGAAGAAGGRPPIAEGTAVAVVAHALGLWWTSCCRVVYTLDESFETGPLRRRFGFAYGTLPAHAERGEERFSVELRDDGSVWYDLLAFSTPRYWLARLGYPLTRRMQRRFVRDSLAAMRRAAGGAPPAAER
jgi:uncharacterized protein (UPF0548 family)